MRLNPITRLLLVALLLWSGWACTDTLLEVVDISHVDVDPASAALSPGQSLQLSATLTDDEGNVLSGRSVQWSSEATGIASVSANGMLLGVAEGTTTITAAAEGVQGSAEVTVSRAPLIGATPDSVALQAILGESEVAAAPVAIVNDGGGTLTGLSAAIEYDAGAPGWLEGTFTSASAPATLELTANAAGLERGTYRASVRLTSSSVGAAPVVVRVVFDVLQRTAAPALISVTPDRSAREQSLEVIMTGANFVPDLTTVSFGAGITVNAVEVEGPTTLTAALTVGPTAAVGTRDVTVTNPPPGGGSATLTEAFIVEGRNPRPALTGVAPASTQRQSTLDVTLEGSGFLEGITIADFGPGVTVNGIDVASATSLTARITIGAGAALGSRDVTVANPEPGGGVGTLREAFTVVAANPAPTLAQISPGSARRLETLTVQLTGTNFAEGLTSIDFGPAITVETLTVTSATTVTASITIGAAAALGPRAVSVTNAAPGGGTAELANAFTVLDANPVPDIESIEPPSARLGQTLDVMLEGSGFVDGVTTVDFGAGITVTNVDVTAAGSLSAGVTIAADAEPGTRDVTVRNPAPGGGSMTLPAAFTVTGALSGGLSSVTAAPISDVAADGTAVSTVTIALRDVANGAVTGISPSEFEISTTGSAVAGAVTETATPGTYAATVSNTVAETITVTVTVEGVELEDTPTIGFVATSVSAANSRVSASPTTGIIADGVASSRVTVVLRDPHDNPVDGLGTTAFAVTVGGSAVAGAISETSTPGTYTFTVTNTVAEAVKIQVSAGGTPLSPEPGIEFVPGAAAPANSSAAVPDGVAGVATALQITLRDGKGNLVEGAAGVEVSVTGANTASPSVTANDDGTYRATYTPTAAGVDLVGITLGGVPIAGSPFPSVVSEGAISAAASDVTAAPAIIVADGVTASTVTIALRDAHGNAVGGLDDGDFTVSVTGAGSADAVAETATSGTYNVDVTSMVAEPVTVTVTAAGVVLDEQPVIQFIAGAVSAANSGVAADPATGVIADGSARSTVTVRVRDGSDNPVVDLGNAAFAVSLSSGSAARGEVTETATAGTYSFGVTNTIAQTVTVTVRVSGVTLSQAPTIEFVAGSATQIAAHAGEDQSATVGTAVPVSPSVIVRDANSNVVAGVPVTFAVTAGGGSLGGSGSVSTNADGIATAPQWTLGSAAGANTLTATSPGLTGSPVTFTATGTAGTPGQLVIATQPSSTATAGVAFDQQPVIQLLDDASNPVAQEGLVVNAAIASGGGTLGGTTTATTDTEGVATFSNLSIAGLVGDRTLRFSASGVESVTSNAISITAGPATQLAVHAGNGQSATIGTAVAIPPSVIVTDASGNPIGGVAVTFGVATGGGSLADDGTVTTNPSGVATSPAWILGPVAGSNTLTATSSGLSGSPVTFTATGTSGDAARLTIATQPSLSAPSGAAFGRQPAVRTHDSEGNVVAEAGIVVTAEIATGGGTLGGTLTATTNSNGLATFTDLSITGLAGLRTLRFGSPDLEGVTSNQISITVGAAAQIAVNAGDNQTAPAGTSVPTSPSVIVRDSGGNPVPGVSVTFAIATGDGALTGPNPVETGTDGIATAPTWTLGTAPGENTMTATAAGVAGAVTFTATGM